MKNSNIFLFGSVILILLAIALVAILDKASPAKNTTDVRARAGTQTTLFLVGTVSSADEAKGTLEVSSVYFADKNRAGDVQNLGNWSVTVPTGFDVTSVSPGATVTIGVSAGSFQVTTHSMTALSIQKTNR